MSTNALADLVTDHCRRTGDTLAAIAKRGGMSRQTLSGIVNNPTPMFWPRQRTLEALAKGLGLSVETVRHVAAATAYGNGQEPPKRRLVQSLIAYAEGLTDPQLEVLVATAQALKTKCPGP